MVVTSEQSLRRRQPVQERSRLRVARILNAASELVEAEGEAAATTRAIAERAGVPVATVYQFFPNREAILREILLDQLEQRDAAGIAILSSLTPSTLAEAVGAMFEFHRQYLIAHRNMAALFYTSRMSGLLEDPGAMRAEFAEAVHNALIEWNLLRADTDPLVTSLTVELGAHLLSLAHHAEPDRVDTILDEGKLALTRYLEAYTATAEAP